MTKRRFTIAITFLFIATIQSCVQKAYDKTVLYKLHTNGFSNIKSVGVRGGDKPLNWENDSPLAAVKDSLYETAVTYHTGYKFTEVKFVVNNDFELKNKSNRRIVFSEKDTTIYEAAFNVEK
jgi:hypothetical protein